MSAVLHRPVLTVPVSERDHVLGPGDAPVTLIEYGDYECPYCGAAQPILKQIKEIIGDDLRFAYRHFPLSRSTRTRTRPPRRLRRPARRAGSGRCTTSSSRTRIASGRET